MTTYALSLPHDEDTQRVVRPSALIDPPEDLPATRRLAEMDLDPPAGPVPAEVLAYFEKALDRERERRAA